MEHIAVLQELILYTWKKERKNAVTAGASGAKLLEVYSPLRLDYLQKAGCKRSSG